MNIFRLFTLCACIGVMLSSCEADDDPTPLEFEDQALTGTLLGNDWTFVDGTFVKADSFFEFNAIYLTTVTQSSHCQFDFSSNLISVSLPETGLQLNTEYDISMADVGIGVIDGSGQIGFVKQGKIEVTSVVDKVLSGRIVVEGSKGTSLNGTFEIESCLNITAFD